MMHLIKVRPIFKLGGDKIDNENFIYVGRGGKYLQPSPLANDYSVKTYGLERCLYIYGRWLLEAVKARSTEYDELLRILNLAKQHPVTFVCYCISSDDYKEDFSNLKCHAQLIRRMLVYLDKNGIGSI